MVQFKFQELPAWRDCREGDNCWPVWCRADRGSRWGRDKVGQPCSLPRTLGKPHAPGATQLMAATTAGLARAGWIMGEATWLAASTEHGEEGAMQLRAEKGAVGRRVTHDVSLSSSRKNLS